MLRILFFASLRERLHCNEQQLALSTDIRTVADVKSCLAGKGGVFAEIFSGTVRVMSAVNQQMVKDEEPVSDGDEVAFFPPVTGG